MKTYIVVACAWCPNCEHKELNSSDATEWECAITNIRMDNYARMGEIPKWCPLEDYLGKVEGVAMTHDILIVEGPSGLPACYINEYRVAGAKPLGGGRVVYELKAKDEDIKTALKEKEE